MSVNGLSKIDKRLISVAAAISVGCKPCTAVTIHHAREVGASEEELKKAVGIALEVKRKACDEMQLEALKHFDTATSKFWTNESCTTEIAETNKTHWLIATSAAFAANSTAGFERYSTAAEQLSATKNEFKMIVEIAQHVKERGAKEVEKIAAMATPVGLREEAVSVGCGCSSDGDKKSTIGCS